LPAWIALRLDANATVEAATNSSNMNTETGLTQNAQGKRTTSVRLEHLDTLERIVRDFGFKDRSHFFQLCTDALLQAHRDGHRLDWPPRFIVRDWISKGVLRGLIVGRTSVADGTTAIHSRTPFSPRFRLPSCPRPDQADAHLSAPLNALGQNHSGEAIHGSVIKMAI
jgi:hypothetical protein